MNLTKEEYENLNETSKRLLNYVSKTELESAIILIDNIIKKSIKDEKLSFFIYFSELNDSFYYNINNLNNVIKDYNMLYNYILRTLSYYDSLDEEEKLEAQFFLDISVIYKEKNNTKLGSFRANEENILFYEKEDLENEKESIENILSEYGHQNIAFYDSKNLLNQLNLF
tara:strand:+ start:33212 stop:33721 length:510 start_codon:yes stop_codon:yes gene_type:complete